MFYSVNELPSLEPLRITDQYILAHTPLWRFMYIDESLDGFLLEPLGICRKVEDSLQTEMYLCSSCHSLLEHNNLPRLALNNGLYRGELPPKLSDITWVEEMACSLY